MTGEPEIHLHGDPDERKSQVAVPNASLPRQIIVRSGVLDAVDAHLAADSSIEHGGVLVGSGDAATGVVVITGSVKALHARGTVASLTFTHETWDYVSQVMETGFPGQKIVGWYHSHPTFGVFLSEYDLFIQRNFFPEPWQIAYVYDPVYDQRGFFGWENGEIVRIPTWESTTSHAGVEAQMPVNVPSRREVRTQPITVDLRADDPVVAPPPPRVDAPRERKGPAVAVAAIVLGLVAVGLLVFALTRGDGDAAEPEDTAEVTIEETDPTTEDTGDEAAPEETDPAEDTTAAPAPVPTAPGTTLPVVVGGPATAPATPAPETPPAGGGEPVVTIETAGGVEAVRFPFSWERVDDEFFPDCSRLSSIGTCVLVDGRFGVEVTADNDDDRPTLPRPDSIDAFLAEFVNEADEVRTLILFESPDEDGSATLQKVMCQSGGVWEVQALTDGDFPECDDTTWAALDLDERRAVCPADEECLRADIVWVPATYSIASGSFPVPVLAVTGGDAVLVCVENDGSSAELASERVEDALAARRLQPGDECLVDPQVGGGGASDAPPTTATGNG